MKLILISALTLAISSTITFANQNYFFDLDGGQCNAESMVYAEFGPEGMAYIEGGNKYTGNGGFILETKNLKNGLVQYKIGPMYESMKPYWVTLDPKGYFGRFKTNNPNDLRVEGAVDTMEFEPCNP